MIKQTRTDERVRGEDQSRRLRWGLGAAVAVVVAVAVVALGLSGSDDATVSSAQDPDTAIRELSPVISDPGDVGPFTELASGREQPAEPDGIERCGGDGSNGNNNVEDQCRITASLAQRATRQSAERSDGNLVPISGLRPTSFGAFALTDAADPTVLVDGQTYYIFSTSAQFMRVPVATVPGERLVGGTGGFAIESRQLDALGEPVQPPTPDAGVPMTTDPAAVVRTEAMPQRPPWARQDDIWAPTVARVDGTYLMYFAAKRPEPPDPVNQECIGRAVATHPAGPYVPDPEPVTCGLGGIHGALDPSVFRDRHTGRLYLLVAFGGTSTPLWSIPLTSDGLPGAGAVPLLGMQHPWETWFLENPSMIFNGTDYTLAYSAGRWSLPSYATGLARCRTPMGPCVSERTRPWLASTGSVTGPGGLDFFTDIHGELMVVHHGYIAGAEAAFGARHTFVRSAFADAQSVELR